MFAYMRNGDLILSPKNLAEAQALRALYVLWQQNGVRVRRRTRNEERARYGGRFKLVGDRDSDFRWVAIAPGIRQLEYRPPRPAKRVGARRRK